jgi:hypothetical protein
MQILMWTKFEECQPKGAHNPIHSVLELPLLDRALIRYLLGWLIRSLFHIPVKIFYSYHQGVTNIFSKQEQRKRGIIRPLTLVKNNKSIQLKSELEL